MAIGHTYSTDELCADLATPNFHLRACNVIGPSYLPYRIIRTHPTIRNNRVSEAIPIRDQLRRESVVRSMELGKRQREASLVKGGGGILAKSKCYRS